MVSRIGKVLLLVACAGNTQISAMWKQTRYAETKLPVLYDKDTAITEELNAVTDIQCGRYCHRTNCSAYLFKSDEFVEDQRCFETAHYEYTGTVNTTLSERMCQNWADQTPHAHDMHNYIDNFPENSLMDAMNYCRDPDNEGYNWCYTTDPYMRWELCDIGRCIASGKNCRLYNITGSATAFRTGYQYFHLNQLFLGP